jgi:hypothetical protein
VRLGSRHSGLLHSAFQRKTMQLLGHLGPPELLSLSHSGSQGAHFGPDSFPGCQPPPLAFLLMNGTANPLVPYQGGTVKLRGMKDDVASAEAPLSPFAAANECSSQRITHEFPDRDPGDGSRVIMERLVGCKRMVELVRVEGGDGDRVEVTEAHRGVGGGVVTGWTHEREGGLAGGERVFGRGERSGSGAAGVIGDEGEIGRIGVEVVGLGKAAQVRGSVGAKKRGVGNGSGGRRDTEFPRGVRGAEVGGGTDDPGGLLRAHGRAVIGALRIVENEHGRGSYGRKKAQEAQECRTERVAGARAIFSFALCGEFCGYGTQL